MRVKPAAIFMAVALVATVAIGGCSSDGGTTDGAGTGDAIEQNGLEVGTKAPDFRLKNQDQATIALSDYAGTKNVILVFYPADFTPV